MSMVDCEWDDCEWERRREEKGWTCLLYSRECPLGSNHCSVHTQRFTKNTRELLIHRIKSLIVILRVKDN